LDAFEPFPVMPGLVPGIHVLEVLENKKDVDGRVKPGHDDLLGPISGASLGLASPLPIG
jgi:hypothetical protein